VLRDRGEWWVGAGWVWFMFDSAVAPLGLRKVANGADGIDWEDFG